MIFSYEFINTVFISDNFRLFTVAECKGYVHSKYAQL